MLAAMLFAVRFMFVWGRFLIIGWVIMAALAGVVMVVLALVGALFR